MASEVSVRARLLLLGLKCGAGSSALALFLGYLWLNGLQPIALVVASFWFVASLPWLLVLLIVGAETLVCAGTGRVMFLPIIFRVSARERSRRGGKKKDTEGLATRLISAIGFYTNPLSPIMMGTMLFLLSRPPLEDAVSSVIQKLYERKTVYRMVGDVGTGWTQSSGGLLAA